MPSPIRSTVVSAVTELPWCCIAPAVFSVSGVAVAGIGAGLKSATPLFLIVSLGFLGRALYLSLIRRHGPRWVRLVTVSAAVTVSLVWSFRLGVWTI